MKLTLKKRKFANSLCCGKNYIHIEKHFRVKKFSLHEKNMKKRTTKQKRHAN